MPSLVAALIAFKVMVSPVWKVIDDVACENETRLIASQAHCKHPAKARFGVVHFLS